MFSERQLHLELCKSCREINNVHTTHMSAQMAVTFLFLTIFSYCIYINPTVNADRPLKKKILYNSPLAFRVVFCTAQLFYIIRSSAKIMLEVIFKFNHTAYNAKKKYLHLNDSFRLRRRVE